MFREALKKKSEMFVLAIDRSLVDRGWTSQEAGKVPAEVRWPVRIYGGVTRLESWAGRIVIRDELAPSKLPR